MSTNTTQTSARPANDSQQASDGRWIVALETVVDLPGKARPVLGYTVLADAQPFESADAASAFIRANNLPIGWARMEADRAPWAHLAPHEPAAASEITPEMLFEAAKCVGIHPVRFSHVRLAHILNRMLAQRARPEVALPVKTIISEPGEGDDWLLEQQPSRSSRQVAASECCGRTMLVGYRCEGCPHAKPGDTLVPRREEPVGPPEGVEPAPGCGCEACMPMAWEKPETMRMIVCAQCGNKRCPHATDHRNACTNSNEPGQPGSSWEHVKPVSAVAADSQSLECPRCFGAGEAYDSECKPCAGSGKVSRQRYEQLMDPFGAGSASEASRAANPSAARCKATLALPAHVGTVKSALLVDGLNELLENVGGIRVDSIDLQMPLSDVQDAGAVEFTPEPPRWHELKTDPEVFDAAAQGLKTHEMRLNDRDFQIGDGLILRKTLYGGAQMREQGLPLVYTGETLRKVITHILGDGHSGNGYGLRDRWVVLSLGPVRQPCTTLQERSIPRVVR